MAGLAYGLWYYAGLALARRGIGTGCCGAQKQARQHAVDAAVPEGSVSCWKQIFLPFAIHSDLERRVPKVDLQLDNRPTQPQGCPVQEHQGACAPVAGLLFREGPSRSLGPLLYSGTL